MKRYPAGKAAIKPSQNKRQPKNQGKRKGMKQRSWDCVDANCLAGRKDPSSDEDSSDEEPLKLECVLPIQGVNHPVNVPVTIAWDHFRSIIAGELGV